MSQHEDVTLGELSRRVERLETQVSAGFEAMRSELRTLTFVPAGVYASDQSGVNMRIQRLEELNKTMENRSWHIRFAIIAAIFSGLMTIVTTVLLVLIGFD